MSNSKEIKNIAEYVTKEVITYVQSEDKCLLDKINSSPALRKFVKEVENDWLEFYVDFIQYQSDFHGYCETHDKYWDLPGRKEFENTLNNEVLDNIYYIYPRILPCCYEEDE
jgi:hypothetical protein